ncbi:MAG: formate dehydrogenase accessory sulfurtransferase FdhD [Planctomycetota bacterium]|jgi:FdhD protein
MSNAENRNSNDNGYVDRRMPDGSEDRLVREEPLTIQVADHSVLTMRTPGDDLHLALGFLLSEGVIDTVADVTEHRFLAGDAKKLQADTIVLHLADVGRARIEGRLTRTHEIRSSCGICGLTDADELLESTTPLLPGVPKVTGEQLQDLRRRFEQDQALFRATGACHGAALFGPAGEIWGQGEDVGRHNALDKAIGRAAAAGHDLRHGIAMLSGRAGSDLVFKCLRLGIPIILSVSATAALSFDLCQAAGATLVGFLREGRMKVYCDGGRLT